MAGAAAVREPRLHHDRFDAGADGDGQLTRSHRPALRLAALFVAAAAALAAVILAVTPAGAATGACGSEPCVVVTVVGQQGGSSTDTFGYSDMFGNWQTFSNTQYYTRAVAGGAEISDPLVLTGVSIQVLLNQVTAGSPTYVEVSAQGRSATLSADAGELAAPSEPGYSFTDGLVPAFYSRDGGNTLSYVRPLHPSDQDTNARDNGIQTSVDGELDVVVHMTGTVVTPTISAAPTTVTAGKPVAFTATADHPGLTYTWNYGDGAQSAPTGRRISYSYSTPGTYYAHVDVTGKDGSSGQSDDVTITVEPASTPDPAPDHTKSTTPPTGPSHGNGPSGNPVGGPTSGHGPHPGGAPKTSRADNSPTPVATASTQAGSPTFTPTGPPGTSPVAGTGTAGGGGLSVVAGGQGAAASSSGSRASAPGRRGGDRVNGYLLVGLAGRVLPVSQVSSSTVPLTAPAARSGIAAHHIAVWLLGVLAVLALLVAGGYAERRPPRRSHG